MEILQLKYFCRAAVTESFAKTAEEFHVPPSAVSQSIKRLETELGAPLFTRSANRIKLAPKGELFYQDAKAALALLEHGKNTVRGTADTGALRVGIRFGRRIVIQAINAFIKQSPQVDVIATKFDSSSDPDDLDIIIAGESLEANNFTSELAFHDQIVLIAPKGLLPPGPTVCAEDLHGQSFITPKENSFMHRYTFKICKSLGFVPRITLKNESSHLIPGCVEQGIGVAFLSLQLWSPVLANKALDIKTVGDFYRDIYIYRKKGHSPKYVDQFYQLLLEEFAKESAPT